MGAFFWLSNIVDFAKRGFLVRTRSSADGRRAHLSLTPAGRAAFAELNEAVGLCVGHRILDIGCGAGDVSFLAADIVGAGGSVVGIDRAPAAIAAARARAHAEGRGNVEFRLESISDMPAGPAFDAVVGRFVLMHQSDPAATCAAAAWW
ncbi:MAG: cyclopropane-fatty-acyl-phospholipid synthase family protein [Vicinamibacterales bacterium]